MATGELLELLGRYEEAEPHFREAIEKGAGPTAYRGLIGSLRRLGRYDDVVAIADEVMSDEAVDEAMRVRLSWEKAAALASLGRLDASLDALLPGRRRRVGSAAGPDPRLLLPPALRPRGAETALVPALEVLEERRRLRVLPPRTAQPGLGALAQDRHEEAIAILEDTLRLAARKASPRRCSRACSTSARSRAGGRISSCATRREAVTQSDRMRHSFHRVASRNNLAYTLVETGQAELAVRGRDPGADLAEEAQLSGVIGTILHTRGTAHLRLGDREAAEADALAAEPLVVGTSFEDEVRDLLEEIRDRR